MVSGLQAQTSPIQPSVTPGVPTTAAQAQQPAAEVSPTVEEIMQVCPDADINSVRKYLPYVLKAMAEAGLTTKNQLVGIVATIYVETGRFEPIHEYGRGVGMGYSGGELFHGRGFIQLTHDYNYKAFSDIIGIDLVSNPDVMLDPEPSAKAMCAYWLGKHNSNQRCVEPAEAANWPRVRQNVNGSPTGYRDDYSHTFKPCIDRGMQIFKSGIDPYAVGAIPLDGSYGLGCADAGVAGGRTLTGVQNPVTQEGALAYALGLHAADRQRSHEFHAIINVASEPDALKLDAQKTFEVKGFGDELDGVYTCDEVYFYPLEDGGLEAEIFAYKPDPNAPPPQVFLHNTNGPALPSQVLPATPSGDIQQRIFQAAQAAKGRSTASGPGGGNVACAWAVNNFCIIPAGLSALGDNPNVVPSVEQALQSGRGQSLSRSQAGPGDIWISPGTAHVGICMTNGCTRVLSNSSSRATFAWEDEIDNVNAEYDSGSETLYRVVR